MGSVGKRTLGLGVFALGILAGSAGATQYLADKFGGAPVLGEPLVSLGGRKVYQPLAWNTWREQWSSHYPGQFALATGMCSAGGLLGFGLARGVCAGSGAPEPTGAYGTARWAETKELALEGLLKPRGIVLAQTEDAVLKRNLLGKWRQKRPGRLLRHDGPEHTLMFAPTRSGKGVGVVVPTLLSWTGSALIYDPKRENWDITAGWRSKFSHCIRFEPTHVHSAHFNPLMEVRPHLDVRDAQNIAEILVNPDSSQESKDHWKMTGQAFLVGVILHVLYAEADKSLAGCLHYLTDPAHTFVQQLEKMLTTRHLPDGVHPAVAGAAREMLNRSDNERSGVLSTAISFLSAYRDPIIARNTSSSDFCLADLMCQKSPVSLYLVVPPSDIDRTRPVMRLLLNFFGRRMVEYLDAVDSPGGLLEKRHSLLYLIDEFPSLGRMPFFVSSLAYLAGYRIKCVLIAQSLNQLEETYGRNNPIMDNCHIRVTYGANDDGTARRIGALLGVGSKMKVQQSESSGGAKTQVSRSHQEYGRPLKTTDELLSLPFADALVMVGGQRPYLGKKVLYYDHPEFRRRAYDAKTGANAPPTSPAAQAAELPPQLVRPYWLGLRPVNDRIAQPAAPPKGGTQKPNEKTERTSAPLEPEEMFAPAQSDDDDWSSLDAMYEAANAAKKEAI